MVGPGVWGVDRSTAAIPIWAKAPTVVLRAATLTTLLWLRRF